MFFFLVGPKVFCFFKGMRFYFFEPRNISRGGVKLSKTLRGVAQKKEGSLADLEFFLFCFGEARQKGVRSVFLGATDSLQDTMMDIWKVIYKNAENKKFISQQSYLYIQVTDILKFYEVLFCTYCKDLFCL